MRKILLASTVVLLAAAGGGGWYVLEHRDPLQQAKALLAKGDYRGANLQLRTAVRDNPKSAEAHALLAQLQLAGNDPIAAEHEIKQAIALNWDPASSMAVLSQAYMRQDKWADILREVPSKGATPEQTAYYMMTRAVAQRGMKDVAGANQTLAEAERLAPENAEVHLAAARFDLLDGHLDQALDEANRSLALDPQRTDALQLKANLLAAKGDRAGAIAELDTAIQGAPQRIDLLVGRAVLQVAQNQDAKASADIDAALSKDPKNVPGLFIKAVLLIRQNKMSEADTVLQGIDPYLERFQRGLYFKALVKSRLGQNGQADDAITTYVNRVPGDADGIRLLGQIELTTQHPNRAIPVLVKAVQAGQRDAETLDLLGRAYAMNGNQREAEATFQQASQQARKPSELTQLATARLQVGDLSGAASDLQHSLEIGPSQPGAGEALVATAIRLGQLDRAQQALDQLRQQSGNTEAVGNLSGLLKLARLDPAGALADFADTATRFPNAIPPRVNQARVLMQLNRANEAIPILQGVLEKTPTQPEALTLYAQILLSQGRGAEAAEAAEKARKADPTNLGLINGEAQIYARLKQFDKALDILNTAQAAGKMPIQLLGTLGGIQLAAGQTDAAKRTFADLVAAEPANIGAALANIELLTRLKDFNGARHATDDALQRQPGNILLLQARVRVDLLDKGLDAALQTADQMRANPSYMPNAALLKGGLLMGAQRYKEAAAAFQGEFQKEPSTALAVAYAQAQDAAGDRTGAVAELQRWQSSHPDDPAIAQTMGTMDISSKNYDDAERNFQIVLKAQPNSVVALNNLAWLYQQKGNKRAREYAQRAFEQEPTPEVTDTLGWILVSQGDAAKAVPLLRSAVAGRPQNPSLAYHLAVALKDTNQTADAIAVLRPVVEGSANFDEKPAAQTLLAELTKAKP